ncbi:MULTISPECIES: hypothetical protein [Paracoccus]|uniref:hypothetical protein n=1 Tax=Paracoccus TaxID=265 RepID=UPI00086C106B|nr:MULTISPECIES: hypothetical protein [Paracoccus]ODT57763.1 MAG: hypothetical protein ABS73_15735 [Paracoccus sp. SCN 68-21]
MPMLGARGPDLDAWRALLGQPGLGLAAALSLWAGLAETVISLALSFGAVAALGGRAAGLRPAMAPLLAAPHAALAIGLAFVIALSGWIVRGLEAGLGRDRPPGLATVEGPWWLALILGLELKEVPFLTVILLAAATQIPLRQQRAARRALRDTGARRSSCGCWPRSCGR